MSASTKDLAGIYGIIWLQVQREEIRSLLLGMLLQNSKYAPADAANAVPSAVLVIIHYHDKRGVSGVPRIILTKRSSKMRTHTGEISFPGGRHCKNDASLVQTAIRETEEEIGIRFSENEILGNLRAVRTMTSNHFIVPFVTVQEKFPEHKLQVHEVEELIDVPLLDVLATISPDTEHYKLASDAVLFTYQRHIIWGATARILRQLHDILIRPS